MLWLQWEKCAHRTPAKFRSAKHVLVLYILWSIQAVKRGVDRYECCKYSVLITSIYYIDWSVAELMKRKVSCGSYPGQKKNPIWHKCIKEICSFNFIQILVNVLKIVMCRNCSCFWSRSRKNLYFFGWAIAICDQPPRFSPPLNRLVHVPHGVAEWHSKRGRWNIRFSQKVLTRFSILKYA
jgi:hypothetical protein